MNLKKIWNIVSKIFLAIGGFFVAWIAIRQPQEAPERIHREAEKEKDKTYEDIKNTPANAVADKYLSDPSIGTINDIKQSAIDRLTTRKGNSKS